MLARYHFFEDFIVSCPSIMNLWSIHASILWYAQKYGVVTLVKGNRSRPTLWTLAKAINRPLQPFCFWRTRYEWGRDRRTVGRNPEVQPWLVQHNAHPGIPWRPPGIHPCCACAGDRSQESCATRTPQVLLSVEGTTANYREVRGYTFRLCVR